jgi:hypothetical protein
LRFSISLFLIEGVFRSRNAEINAGSFDFSEQSAGELLSFAQDEFEKGSGERRD